MKRTIIIVCLITLLSVVLIIPASATTWDVYEGQSIQDAINGASDGDTVFVHAGTYLLPTIGSAFHILVDKPNITLKGEGADKTILDGNRGIAIYVGVANIPPNYPNGPAPGCIVEGFRIENGSTGISVANSPNCIIRNNVLKVPTALSSVSPNTIIKGNIMDGMTSTITFQKTASPITFIDNIVSNSTKTLSSTSFYTSNSTIANNTFINNVAGMNLYTVSITNTTVTGNNFVSCGAGIRLYNAPSGNRIYLNNIVNNTKDVDFGGTGTPSNNWNSTTPLTYTYKGASHTGYPGNFWSNYTGTDTDDDGIIDTPKVLPSSLGTDYAPLVGAWKNGEIISPAVGPVANFTADIRTGTTPLTVTFTDQSTGSPTTWAWDVNNDGSVDYTTQNATHTYTTAGNYTVNLTVKNAGGSDSEVKTDYITVTIPTAPVANFSANITSGTAPLTVRFTDESTNTPTSWFWDFGDGSMATTRDATHTYTTYGTRTVNLTVTNAAGSNSMVRDKYITVTESPAERARIILPAASLYRNTGTQLPVQVMNVTGGTGISFDLAYDPAVIRIDEITLNQSYASGSNLAVNATPGRIRVALTRTDGINIGSPVPVFILNTTGIGAVGVSTPLTLTNARWGDGTFNYRTFDTVNGTALVYRHRGDLNGNGGIDIGDTAWTAWMVVDKTADLIPDADFNNNGRIDIGDATKIAYYLVGKIPDL